MASVRQASGRRLKGVGVMLAAVLLAAGCTTTPRRGGPPPHHASSFTTPDGLARIHFPGRPKEDRRVATRVVYAIYNERGSYLLSIFSREDEADRTWPLGCPNIMQRGGYPPAPIPRCCAGTAWDTAST